MSKRASASTAKETEPRIYRKPRADVYTVMLSIALIAVSIAATALWLVMGQYHNEIKGGPNPTWIQPAAPSQIDAPRAIV